MNENVYNKIRYKIDTRLVRMVGTTLFNKAYYLLLVTIRYAINDMHIKYNNPDINKGTELSSWKEL